jgi:hypothetical protein
MFIGAPPFPELAKLIVRIPNAATVRGRSAMIVGRKVQDVCVRMAIFDLHSRWNVARSRK